MVCRAWWQRCVRAPMDSMAFVLVVDLSQEEDVRSLYLHL
jgi:hypothetical protein